MSVDEIAVYIFSYNRPAFLRNCVESVFSCIPGVSVTVVDDGSNDQSVTSYIRYLGVRIRTISPAQSSGTRIGGPYANMNVNEANTVSLRASRAAGVDLTTTAEGKGEIKTGGLYANMNLAMQDASTRGLRYAFFIQDDMQLVRPFLASDSESVDQYFMLNPKAVQLDTCFRKRQFVQADRQFGMVDPSGTAYIRSPGHPGMRGITQLGVFHVKRFLAAFDQFERGEVTNERKALSLGLRVGYYAWPNMMWLPFPEAWRGKAKSMYLRLQEYFGRVGFYPYQYLTDEEVERLFARDVAEIPVAEDWLSCPSAPKSPRWSFAGGLDNVRARGGIYALCAMVLGRIERARWQ